MTVFYVGYKADAIVTKMSLAGSRRQRGFTLIEVLVDVDSLGRNAGDVRRASDIEQSRSGVGNTGDRQCRIVGSYNGRTNVQ